MRNLFENVDTNRVALSYIAELRQYTVCEIKHFMSEGNVIGYRVHIPEYKSYLSILPVATEKQQLAFNKCIDRQPHLITVNGEQYYSHYITMNFYVSESSEQSKNHEILSACKSLKDMTDESPFFNKVKTAKTNGIFDKYREPSKQENTVLHLLQVRNALTVKELEELVGKEVKPLLKALVESGKIDKLKHIAFSNKPVYVMATSKTEKTALLKDKLSGIPSKQLVDYLLVAMSEYAIPPDYVLDIIEQFAKTGDLGDCSVKQKLKIVDNLGGVEFIHFVYKNLPTANPIGMLYRLLTTGITSISVSDAKMKLLISEQKLNDIIKLAVKYRILLLENDVITLNYTKQDEELEAQESVEVIQDLHEEEIVEEVKLPTLDPLEQEILTELATGDKQVKELVKALGITDHKVRKTLKSLEKLNLVTKKPYEYMRSNYGRYTPQVTTVYKLI